jgi:hypothetical protein
MTTTMHYFVLGIVIGAPFGFAAGWVARNIAAWGG